MVKLRLFAQAREAAPSGSLEFSAATVGEVLEKAIEKSDQEFAAIVEMSSIWLNGKSTEYQASVSEGDEVAVIPPVSGG